MMETDSVVLGNIKRAHDTLDGCLLGLAVSESTRGILRDQLRILYEYAMYPMLAPGTGQKATSSLASGTGGVSNVSGGDPSFDEKDYEHGHR
jgi:hypothetical protein